MLTAFPQQVNPGLPTGLIGFSKEKRVFSAAGKISYLVRYGCLFGRAFCQARLYLAKNPGTIPAMKMKLITILAVVDILLAFTVSAQEGPVRILPAPAPQPGIAVEVEPLPFPPNFFPDRNFLRNRWNPRKAGESPGFLER